jgi:hypothetical protein
VRNRNSQTGICRNGISRYIPVPIEVYNKMCSGLKGQFHESWFERERITLKIKNGVNLCVTSRDTVDTVRRRQLAFSWALLGSPGTVDGVACGVCAVRSTTGRNTRPHPLTVHKGLSGYSTFCSTPHLCVCVCVCVCVCDCVRSVCMFHSFQTKVIVQDL